MNRKRKPTVLTRSDSGKKFGGQPSPLNETDPPCLRQVIQYSYFLQNSHPDLKDYDIAKIITKDVIKIWKSVNPRLPLYEEYYVVKLVDRVCFKKVKEINRKRHSKLQEQNLEEKLDKLFDISACTCNLPIRPCDDKVVKCHKENCQTQHIICTCPPSKKVPLEDREYLKDQRSKIGRKGCFQLGTVDKAAVSKDRRAAALSGRLEKQIQKQQGADLSTLEFTSSHDLFSETISGESGESCGDEIETEVFEPGRCRDDAYSFLKTPRYAMELIRGDVSSNLGASLANALLLDLQAMDLLRLGVNVKQIVVDKSKLDREKERMRVKSNEMHDKSVEQLLCIGIDGKVDKDTLAYKEIKDKNGEKKLKKGKGQEHHLTFTKELGNEDGTYLTHRVIPVKGATGTVLAEEVVSVLEEFNSVHTVRALLVDNTNTNTGCEGGLVTVLENKIKRKLHTIGCSLHQNELPFRAVFKYLDGSTTSPTAFTGPLGKLCEGDYHELTQVEFTKLSGPLDEMEFSEQALNGFSCDQRLLLEYVLGISRGKVNSRFAAWKIGPLNHARWLTLAIRLMCLWTRGVYPTELQGKLYQAIKFIVQVYAVSWFKIKRDNEFHNQQLYIFNMIQKIKQQSKEIQHVALNNIKYNAFALLPENMLYSMMLSEDVNVRKAALEKILSIRNGEPAKKRLKRITTINWEANHWSELINLSQSSICEPALTEDFPIQVLQESLMNGTKLELPVLPSHSQSVERAVKLVSEASHTVYGLESRHKHILAKTLSRRMRPSFISKGYYIENYDSLDM